MLAKFVIILLVQLAYIGVHFARREDHLARELPFGKSAIWIWFCFWIIIKRWAYLDNSCRTSHVFWIMPLAIIINGRRTDSTSKLLPTKVGSYASRWTITARIKTEGVDCIGCVWMSFRHSGWRVSITMGTAYDALWRGCKRNVVGVTIIIIMSTDLTCLYWLTPILRHGLHESLWLI